jgi:hypothetical protein
MARKAEVLTTILSITDLLIWLRERRTQIDDATSPLGPS